MLSCQSISHCYGPVELFVKAFFDDFFLTIEKNRTYPDTNSKIVGIMVIKNSPGMFKFEICFFVKICKRLFNLFVCHNLLVCKACTKKRWYACCQLFFFPCINCKKKGWSVCCPLILSFFIDCREV